MAEAWERALRCDPVSAFGGIVALNRTLDAAAAAKIADDLPRGRHRAGRGRGGARDARAKKNLRLLLTGGLPDPACAGSGIRSVAGGFLVQTRDAGRIDARGAKVVTKRAPTARELADLLFAWRVCKHVKSNAIVYAQDGATVGIGAGQMSRVDAPASPPRRRRGGAGGRAARAADHGSVVASDAFFPFADGLEAAIAAGATAVIQPGGSIRDAGVIAAADAAGIAMVFTGIRHFRH